MNAYTNTLSENRDGLGPQCETRQDGPGSTLSMASVAESKAISQLTDMIVELKHRLEPVMQLATTKGNDCPCEDMPSQPKSPVVNDMERRTGQINDLCNEVREILGRLDV